MPVRRNLSEGLESGQCRRWREASERIDLDMFKVLEAGLERAEVYGMVTIAGWSSQFVAT